MLFCDPQTCLSEMLVNGSLSLRGQAFHTLHFNLLFLINTRFRWHLFWQIFGPQPGTRGSGPVEELSQGSKPRLVRTTLIRSHQDISALWRSAARATALLCCWRSSFVLSCSLWGITHLFYLPPIFYQQ